MDAGAEASAADRQGPIGLAAAVLVPVLTFALSKGGMEGDVAGATASGAMACVTYGLLRRQERAKSIRQRVNEAVTGNVAVNPVLVSVAVALVLVTVESIVSALIGAVAGAVLAFVGAMDALSELYPYLALWFILPSFVVMVVPVFKVAAQHLGARALKWLLLAILLSRLIRVTIIVALASSLSSMGFQFAPVDVFVSFIFVAIALAVAMLLGLLWARRTSDSFLLARLIRRLEPADRATALELLR